MLLFGRVCSIFTLRGDGLRCYRLVNFYVRCYAFFTPTVVDLPILRFLCYVVVIFFVCCYSDCCCDLLIPQFAHTSTFLVTIHSTYPHLHTTFDLRDPTPHLPALLICRCDSRCYVVPLRCCSTRFPSFRYGTFDYRFAIYLLRYVDSFDLRSLLFTLFVVITSYSTRLRLLIYFTFTVT